jgi:regulator of sigma E protease
LEERVGLYGKLPVIPAIIGTVQEDSAATAAGLLVGDLITGIGGQPINDWRDLVGLVQTRAEQDTAATIERAGEPMELTIRPRKLEVDGRTIGILGITPAPVDIPEDMFVRVRSGPFAAF